MSQMPIPDDWDGQSWCNYVVCWPDSTLWRGILAGFLTQAARGRFWDASTGSILDVQAVGREIIEQNTDSGGEILGCSDLIAALQGIEAAVQAIETAQVNIAVSADSTATSTAQANAILVDLSKQIAIAQAWAESMAQVQVGVHIENNVNTTIGSVSPTNPPILEQEPETGISPTPAPSNELCDRVVYIVDGSIAYFKALQDLSFGIGEFTINTWYGILGDVFSAIPIYSAAGLPSPIVSAGLLAAIVGELYAQFLIGVGAASRDAGRQFVEDRRESLICLLWNAANSGDETSIIRQAIEQEAISSYGLSQPAANLVLGWYSTQILAFLYYTSGLVSIPVTSEDCDGLCGV